MARAGNFDLQVSNELIQKFSQRARSKEIHLLRAIVCLRALNTYVREAAHTHTRTTINIYY